MLDSDAEAKRFGFSADIARQAADGRIIAARSDGKQLKLWIDGGEETLIPLPEDICWSFEDNLNPYRLLQGDENSLLRVGENGLLLLGDFVSETAPELDHFYVYDISDGEWKLIEDTAHGLHERPLVFGENSKVFAVYDADRIIRIYGWDDGKQLCSIDAGLPVISVEKIGMIVDDEYVYVLTCDGRFLVYCAETGENVFVVNVGTVARENRFSCRLDRENARLYLCADGKLFCIDTRNWVQLFSRQNGYAFYSAAANEIYIMAKDAVTNENTVQAIPVPATAELVKMVRDYLY